MTTVTTNTLPASLRLARILSWVVIVLSFVITALALAPYVLPVQAQAFTPHQLNTCPDGRAFAAHAIAPAGGPSSCMVEQVRLYHGSAITALMVDTLWELAQTRHGKDTVDPLWRELAKASVQDIDRIDWPVAFYAHVPILRDWFSPKPLRECIANLRAGQRCASRQSP